MSRVKISLFIFALTLCLAGLWLAFYTSKTEPVPPLKEPLSLEEIESKYKGVKPKHWGENLKGVTTLVPDSEAPVVYLTFDLCMKDYDRALVEYLIEHGIQATFFINARWIDKHVEDFLALAKNPLFSIQNHGTLHRPLSVNGREIYHIKGTESVRGVYDEIMGNDRRIFELSGKRARYFRSGTAYYDEVAIAIAKDLGYEIGGFDVLGDGGASFSKARIIKNAQKAQNGSILIYHANKPKSETFAGIKEVIPLLAQRGFRFGKLE